MNAHRPPTPRPRSAALPPSAVWAAVAVSLSLLAGCHSSTFVSHERTSPRTPESAPLDALVDALIGSFSSSAQSERDPAFRHVVLHMAPMHHLAEVDPPTRWLYIEQAMAESRDRPYRQRIYRLRLVPDVDPPQFESAVFEIEGDPLRLTGLWNDPRRLVVIDQDDLLLRDGCEVILRGEGNRWFGATVEDRCPSSFMGAAYATSEVEIDATMIRTWDRGYDADGNQVWGSTAGPYEFRRQ